jgi:hypothetical protein
MRISRKEAQKVVRKGARLLDRRKSGWARRINVPELRLSSACDCVLGQLYVNDSLINGELFSPSDGFHAGLRRLDLSWNEAVDRGFTTLGGSGWRELQAAWEAEIGRRLLRGH